VKIQSRLGVYALWIAFHTELLRYQKGELLPPAMRSLPLPECDHDAELEAILLNLECGNTVSYLQSRRKESAVTTEVRSWVMRVISLCKELAASSRNRLISSKLGMGEAS
jgi:hypothetical protein